MSTLCMVLLMTTQIADLVGLAEIADRCQVNKNVASGWTRKHDFPQVKHKLAMGPMWDWTEVSAYVGSRFTHRQEVPLVCTHCGQEGAHTARDAVAGGGTGALISFDMYCIHCGGETSVEIFNGRGRLALFTDMVGGDEEGK